MAKADSSKINDVMADLKSGKYYPIYFLMGDEPYYIDFISNYIAEKVLSEDEKVFNQTIVYGKDKDIDIRSVINLAKQYPMMSERRVVVLKEAQNLKENSLEDLMFYAQNPQELTILVICYKYKKLDMRKKYASAIEKSGLVFESKALYENQVQDFIKSYLAAHKRKIDERSVQLLTSCLGTDLGHIISELEKLKVAENSDTITPEIIERNIGISRSYNDFELTDALAERNALKAFQIVAYFTQNNHPIQQTLPILFNFFSNLLIYRKLKADNMRDIATEMGIKSFFLKKYDEADKKFSKTAVWDIVSLIREFDAKSKGIDCGKYCSEGLLEELVGKILQLPLK